MRDWDQDIFEELISDNRFVAWVNGDEHCDKQFWDSWVLNYPQNAIEFQEAVRMVKRLNFRGLEVSQLDIEYSWAKTTARIHQQNPPSRTRQLLLKASRVAAILAIPLFLLSSWLFFSQLNLNSKYSSLLENKHNQQISIVAPIGARIKIDLPDGSMAWLNSGSELTYPVVFNNSERRVSLTGEAFFKVQKDKVPFFVSNLGPEIKVYGTEFNVNSYLNEDEVTVALVEGKISLNLGGKEEFLNPGQVSVFNRTKKSVSIENLELGSVGSWREGKYNFTDTPLSAILRILQRQHNVNIQLKNPELGNYRYRLSINNESLEQILQLLSLSAPIKYNYIHRVPNPDGSSNPDKIEISADRSRIIKN